MTEKYLGQFDKWEKGTKEVNGVETEVIYGFKGENKKVIAMNIEVEGKMRMTRVGEYTDAAVFSYYTVILPEYSSEGRFSVTDKTSQILLGEPEGAKDVNIWNSLAKQLGFATAAEARDFVMIKNGGKLRFKVAYGERNKATDKSPMTDLPYEANFNLPIEIRTIITKADYENIPQEFMENMIHSKYDTDPKEGVIHSSLFWTKPNGQIVIYSISTYAEYYGMTNLETMPKKYIPYVNDELREHIAEKILTPIQLIENGILNKSTFPRLSNYLVEIDGLTFKDPSQ